MKSWKTMIVGGIAALALAGGAQADQGNGASLAAATNMNLAFNPGDVPSSPAISLGMLGSLQDDPADAEVEAATPRFGAKGSTRFNIHAGYAVHVKTSENELAVGGVGWSFFLDDNVSLDIEFNGMGVWQEIEDAAAFNFNLLFRWHFYAQETWSIYFDGGAGLLLSSEDVPANGSSFNFTPQAGFGATFDVGNENRMMVGVRWHHISNANLYDENPGRDSLMGYIGLSMPF